MSRHADHCITTARIVDQAEDLNYRVALWVERGEGHPRPGARRAAHDAVADIDTMLATLHRLRQNLITEIRRSDDDTAGRVDALLSALGDGA